MTDVGNPSHDRSMVVEVRSAGSSAVIGAEEEHSFPASVPPSANCQLQRQQLRRSVLFGIFWSWGIHFERRWNVAGRLCCTSRGQVRALFPAGHH